MPKVATLSTNCKDKFLMIVSITVLKFVKIAQALTILHLTSVGGR